MAAQAPVPFVLNGQFVSFNGTTCLVTGIDPKLGFNKYSLLDIDSGRSILAHRHELERVEVLDMGLEQELFGMDAEMDCGENSYVDLLDEEKPSRPVTDRFAKISTEELDKISAERNCPNTMQQTKWAMNIFRGEFLYLLVGGACVKVWQ